jgi:hypothetical protein
MSKYFVIQTSTTEDIYGYVGGILNTNNETIERLKTLKAKFDAIKKIDNEVNSVTYYNFPININLLNDEFDEVTEKGRFQEFSDDDYNTFTNCDENTFKVNSPYVRVNEFGFHVIWDSQRTSDEVSFVNSWEVLGL